MSAGGHFNPTSKPHGNPASGRVKTAYGNWPRYTYAVGSSNGGYQVRRALEAAPKLFDGGVDWEGTYVDAQALNILTDLPPAILQLPGLRGVAAAIPTARRRRTSAAPATRRTSSASADRVDVGQLLGVVLGSDAVPVAEAARPGLRHVRERHRQRTTTRSGCRSRTSASRWRRSPTPGRSGAPLISVAGTDLACTINQPVMGAMFHATGNQALARLVSKNGSITHGDGHVHPARRQGRGAGPGVQSARRTAQPIHSRDRQLQLAECGQRGRSERQFARVNAHACDRSLLIVLAMLAGCGSTGSSSRRSSSHGRQAAGDDYGVVASFAASARRRAARSA